MLTVALLGIRMTIEVIIMLSGKRSLPFKPTVTPSTDELIVNAIWESNPKKIDVGVDNDGNILVDKDKHPDLYDWAVNG